MKIVGFPCLSIKLQEVPMRVRYAACFFGKLEKTKRKRSPLRFNPIVVLIKLAHPRLCERCMTAPPHEKKARPQSKVKGITHTIEKEREGKKSDLVVRTKS